MSSIHTDVVVVGAGIAGLTTALRLAEQGVNTLVLERGQAGNYLCNTRMAGGAFHVAHQDVADDSALILRAITNRTGDSAPAELLEALANDIGEATQWLKRQGIRFIKVGHESYRKHTLAPPIATRGREYWVGRGGDVLLRTLTSSLEKHGGRILHGARAKGLVMRDGACVGLHAECTTGPVDIEARAVVICDGGFHSNMDLLREFISPAPEKLKQRNARTGQGDGLRMARDAGARLVGLNRFYGHVLAQDAMHNDDLWPFPMMDFVCAAGVVVDESGRRFVNEGLGGVTMANAIAAQADPLGATVIFDADIWNGPGREYLISANPTLVSNGGTLYSASDLGSLASQVGLPADVLQQTVAQYNAAVDSGSTGNLAPTRSTDSYQAWPIRKAPFHAVKLCAGITYTMGGIATDVDGRVLDTANRPIANLYAAGCATGGIEGGGDREQVAYIGGLSRSTVFGLRAANAIALALVAA
ncbi:FAD-binding protein (plasmid) [Cupriavidus necator]|uniref:FAD-binding protein n=1 Tax=Cupriavidus necator TaxID=106590 RepID=A0A1U9V2Y4_CUPNE|nr:FAD-dependent oxidoreductase [Cupriavidus necator]AQV99179.1 FAD-binding protein [Cupriavidus necator]